MFNTPTHTLAFLLPPNPPDPPSPCFLYFVGILQCVSHKVCGIFEIIISLGSAMGLYRLFLDVEWFGVLNFLSLFVMLGIGADDIFVLVDAWKQSAFRYPPGDLESRMVWTLHRSARAMAVTSFTSAAAFFAGAVSVIPPLRLFGVSLLYKGLYTYSIIGLIRN